MSEFFSGFFFHVVKTETNIKYSEYHKIFTKHFFARYFFYVHQFFPCFSRLMKFFMEVLRAEKWEFFSNGILVFLYSCLFAKDWIRVWSDVQIESLVEFLCCSKNVMVCIIVFLLLSTLFSDIWYFPIFTRLCLCVVMVRRKICLFAQWVWGDLIYYASIQPNPLYLPLKDQSRPWSHFGITL